MKALLLACAIVLSASIIAHAGDQDPIKACYAKRGGALRLNNTIGGCKATEVAISWNQQGPVGPQGEAGEASGAAFRFLTDSGPWVAGEAWKTVTCPEGMGVVAAFARMDMIDNWGVPQSLSVQANITGPKVEMDLRYWNEYYAVDAEDYQLVFSYNITCA